MEIQELQTQELKRIERQEASYFPKQAGPFLCSIIVESAANTNIETTAWCRSVIDGTEPCKRWAQRGDYTNCSPIEGPRTGSVCVNW